MCRSVDRTSTYSELPPSLFRVYLIPRESHVFEIGSEAWTRTRINGVRVRCATNCTTSEQFLTVVIFHFLDRFVQV